MDLQERARLVRAYRVEIKQEAVYYVARRQQERVERPVRRAAARVGRFIDRQLDAHRARETARLRRINTREAARIRTEGYDIRPNFGRQSAELNRDATATSFRNRAGTGVNRWRGSVRQIGLDARARRPQAPPAPPALIDQTPGDAQFPEPRRRQPRATIVYGRQRRRN